MQKIYETAESEEICISYDDCDIQGLYTIHHRAGQLIVLDRTLPCGSTDCTAALPLMN